MTRINYYCPYTQGGCPFEVNPDDNTPCFSLGRNKGNFYRKKGSSSVSMEITQHNKEEGSSSSSSSSKKKK